MKEGQQGRRDERGCKENMKNWGKRRVEVDAASGRVNFTDGAEVRKSETLSLTHTHAHAHTHTGVGQIPISSPHILSRECKCGAYEGSWSKSYWV